MLARLAVSAVVVLGAASCSDAEPRPMPDAGDADTGGDVLDPNCPAGQRQCDGECTNPAVDPFHCGACGTQCDSTEVCVDGECGCAEDRRRCGVACVDIDASREHCGGCGRPCGAGELCQAGDCVLECDAGLEACGGSCVDVAANEDHCGACDRPCAPGVNQTADCVAGGCVRECLEDWYDLDDERGCETFCDPAAPGAEVCDGEDNDCDGAIDEADDSYEPVLCPLQDGVCDGATSACVAGELLVCDALLYGENAGELPYDADFETWCDGQDNDCDGTADEDCCTPADLPIEVPAAVLPGGLDHLIEAGIYPLEGAPAPLSVVPSLATVGATSIGRINLVDYPAHGGHGRMVELLAAEIAVDVPTETLLEAIWNDGVVLYTRNSESGIVSRWVFELDGTQRDVEEVALPEGVGTVRQLRARVLADGAEALVVGVGEAGAPSDVQFYTRVPTSSGGLTWSGSLTAVVADGRALDVVGSGAATSVCVAAPEMAAPVVCITLNSEGREVERTAVSGALVTPIPPRFTALPDGSYQVFLSTEDGLGVLDTRISAEGEVTQTETAIATVEGLVYGGMLPNGELGLLTARVLDGESLRTQTSLTVPGRAGAVVASYAGTAAIPLGLVNAPEASYVVVSARGGTDGGAFTRSYAFRLSRDGSALCIED